MWRSLYLVLFLQSRAREKGPFLALPHLPSLIKGGGVWLCGTIGRQRTNYYPAECVCVPLCQVYNETKQTNQLFVAWFHSQQRTTKQPSCGCARLIVGSLGTRLRSWQFKLYWRGVLNDRGPFFLNLLCLFVFLCFEKKKKNTGPLERKKGMCGVCPQSNRWQKWGSTPNMNTTTKPTQRLVTSSSVGMHKDFPPPVRDFLNTVR